jgi:hypothetical protein
MRELAHSSSLNTSRIFRIMCSSLLATNWLRSAWFSASSFCFTSAHSGLLNSSRTTWLPLTRGPHWTLDSFVGFDGDPVSSDTGSPVCNRLSVEGHQQWVLRDAPRDVHR